MFHQEVTATSINTIRNASEAKLAVWYKKVLLKIKSCNNHLWFNSKCLKFRVFPRYINIKCKSKSREAQEAVKNAKIVWLRGEIKKWYTIRQFLYTHHFLIHSELVNKLHPVMFDEIVYKARVEVNYNSHKQYLKQSRKLRELVNSNNTINEVDPINCDQKFHPRVVNLSSTNFNQAEVDFLKQGLSYVPPGPPTNKELLHFAMDTHYALKNDPCKVKSDCLKILKSNFNKSRNVVLNKNLKHIKNKLNDQNLILCKADKGNTITILDQDSYVQKVSNFIDSSKINLLQQDPTTQFQNCLKNTLKDCKHVFENSNHRFINSNPSAPILYGLPKIHKSNIPIRPVVSYINAPTYKLCKFLNENLPFILDFKPQFSIKNSLELIEKISKIHVPTNSKLISLDVSSLFTSIPIPELLTLIKTRLRNINNNKEFYNLTDLCLKQNYFSFNDKFYKQEEGLPMGSPLSPLLAEIFMDNLESNFLKNNSQNVVFWYRYVDDIICLWKGSERQLDHFVNKLNNMYSSLNFTVEIEINNSLNFLDLSISRHNNKFEFDIYRKPTCTDTVIPFHSNHPFSIKMSAFHNFVHRLVVVPLSYNNFIKELNIIKNIAFNNGYNPNMVQRILHKKQRKIIQNSIFKSTPEPKNTSYKKIYYIGQPSQKISNILNHNSVQAAFYRKNSLKTLINNKIGKKDKFLKSGIYKINCNDCEAFYIGKTCRNFYIRFQEHMRAWKYERRDSSNLAKHLIDKKHTCNLSNLEILHVETAYHKLEFLESYEISLAIKNKSLLLNEQIELGDSVFLGSLVFPN